ncbi:MAG: hypothetical protein AAF772_16160, partial [Acidobacteriota bacterium]
ALTTASEIGRADARRRALGRGSVCALIDHPLTARGSTLFGLWEQQIFGAGAYHGHYVDAASGAPRSSAAPLDAGDKRYAVGLLLEDRFVGRARVDFAALCDRDAPRRSR